MVDYSKSFNLDPTEASKNTATKQNIFIKDADMQIHVPTPKDVMELEDTHQFKNVMSTYLADVNTLQHDADAQIQRLVAGETENLHEVMMAVDEAETSFSLMMEIRNKLVGAYQEILRTQI
jgi:flagellar hook-basal body complex protein FliE